MWLFFVFMCGYVTFIVFLRCFSSYVYPLDQIEGRMNEKPLWSILVNIFLNCADVVCPFFSKTFPIMQDGNCEHLVSITT